VGAIIGYIWSVFVLTLAQLAFLLGPGLVLAFLMNMVSKAVEIGGYTIFGRTWYLALFGWIGTVVHELGHAFFCIVFGHTITDMNLFNPDPNSGSLGYVNHTYDPNSSYQMIGNFFIGIGPVLFGSALIIWLSSYLINPNLSFEYNIQSFDSVEIGSFGGIAILVKGIFSSAKELMGQVFSLSNLVSIKFYIFLYLTFAIGSSITLSPPDLEGASLGFGALLGTLFAINFVTKWIGSFVSSGFLWVAKYVSVFYAVMLVAIILNLIAAAVFLVIPVAGKRIIANA